MHELGCNSLEEIYDMSWREFSLRRLGYFREEKAKWEKVRFSTYYSMVATGAIDTRKTSIDKFFPLNDKKAPKISKQALEALKKANEEYNGNRT